MKYNLSHKNNLLELFFSMNSLMKMFGLSEVKMPEAKVEGEKKSDFLDCLLFENSNVKYYKTQVSKFINNIDIWVGQRQLNYEHVMSLAKQFSVEQHVMGTFKVVRSQENKVRLIDGQHRYFALKEILKLESDFDCDIFIELYETDRLESNHTLKLFENANNVLNVQPEDMSNKIALSIVDKLSTRFGDIFRDIEDGKRCFRPYINKRLLLQKLRRTLQEKNISEELLINSILEYNENIRITQVDNIDLSVSSIRLCQQSGCYLGFEKDCSWIDEILIQSD